MKKKMQVLSGVATAVVSTGVVNIQAEELPHPAEVKPAIAISQVQKAAVTEAEVTGAKTALDTASQAVSTQQAVVHQAHAEAATAQAVVNHFQYGIAKNAFYQAPTANTHAEAAKIKALQAQVTTAQEVDPFLTPKAEIRFIEARTAAGKSEAEHKEAQANLANLKADVEIKQFNPIHAKQILVEKQAILNQTNQVLAKEQGKLAQLRVDLQQAQSKVMTAQEQLFIAQSNLKAAQNYLVSLESGPARLEQVKARLLHSTTVLKAKEAVLTESQSKLVELKQVEAKAAYHYQTVLTAYQNHLEAQRQEELAKQYESLVRAGKQPVPVVDGGGRVTGYVADMPKEQPSPKAKLPKTGSVSSVLLPLLGYLGLAAFSSKSS